MFNANAMLYGMMAGQQVGQYHLESLLGAGGFGGVFRANEVVRDRVLRQVAVKVIAGNNEQQLEELLAAASLEHDQLVRCYAAGECHLLNIDALYLAMELADGDLGSHFQAKPLETKEICQIIREVAAGLAYLHAQKQVHRDLKPGNVLRVKERWKLSDFGLVRHVGANSYLQTANPIGTIAYMPPEAFEGKISSAWDMWSLGIMVVQMVSANLPYRFSEPTQLLKQVMNAAVELPPLPEELRPIVEGCLQTERGERWSAEQVLEALRPASTEGAERRRPHRPLSHVPQTTQFLSTCPEAVYQLVPQYFVDQADTGWNKHQLTGDFFLNRLVSIELNNPSLHQDLTSGETHITCKLKLRAIMDANHNFVPQQQERTQLQPGHAWLRGHYSPEIRFDRALVEAGYITPEELEVLIKCEELWRSMGTEKYARNAAPGAKPNSKKRLYLAAKTVDAKFQFFYNIWSNPQTGEQLPGLTELAWTGMYLKGVIWL